MFWVVFYPIVIMVPTVQLYLCGQILLDPIQGNLYSAGVCLQRHICGFMGLELLFILIKISSVTHPLFFYLLNCSCSIFLFAQMQHKTINTPKQFLPKTSSSTCSAQCWVGYFLILEASVCDCVSRQLEKNVI